MCFFDRAGLDLIHQELREFPVILFPGTIRREVDFEPHIQWRVVKPYLAWNPGPRFRVGDAFSLEFCILIDGRNDADQADVAPVGEVLKPRAEASQEGLVVAEYFSRAGPSAPSPFRFD